MTRDRSVLKTRPTSSQILARILEVPDLADALGALPAPALAGIIDAVGLEDAGEIVAFASPEQLAEVFDQDLWRSETAGGDERFDGDRFLVWLEVMFEAGEPFVAERLASLPEDLVALAFHEHLLVLDTDDVLAEMRELDEDEGNAIEKALSNRLSEEIDQFQLIARRHEGWDTLLAALLALDREHHDLVTRILERLSALTAEHVDREGGLHSALTSEEMLEGDVAAEREDRRAELGHVAPADARAFLKLPPPSVAALPTQHDPVTRAYFRTIARAMANKPKPAAPRTLRSRRAARGGPAPLVVDAEPSTLIGILVDAGVVAPAGPSLRLGARSHAETLLVRTMRYLADNDVVAFTARSEEIAYLANVLVAGASHEGRRYRIAEAVQKAVDVCNRGLELAGATRDARTVLREHPADVLFKLAWSSGK